MKKTLALILTACALTTFAWTQNAPQKAAKQPAAQTKTADQGKTTEQAQTAEQPKAPEQASSAPDHVPDAALLTPEKDIVVPGRKFKPVGLSASLDYVSDYLWRGTYWFNGDGAFFPTLTYSVLNTGLIMSTGVELSQDYLFDGTEEAGTGGKQAVSFGLDYSYNFDGKATLGSSIWYYCTFNRLENSMMNMSIWATLDSVPFSPGIRYTHDFYFYEEQYYDLYVEIFGSHDFRLTKTLIIDVGLSMGYYYSYFHETNGISDITMSSHLIYERGGFTIKGGFTWIIVPMEDYYGHNMDINRFFANVGLAYSI